MYLLIQRTREIVRCIFVYHQIQVNAMELIVKPERRRPILECFVWLGGVGRAPVVSYVSPDCMRVRGQVFSWPIVLFAVLNT